jgi:phosphatidate cytidylyltransferase
MTNTTKRILTAFGMITAIAIAAYFGMIRWLSVAIAAGMIVEFVRNKIKTKTKGMYLVFAYSLLFLVSAYFVSVKPWIMFLLFLIIASTDTGAWFFGKKIGGDKMWPSLSPNKTWAGQIAGIICGTSASIMYGLLGTDVFLPSLMWIGMGVALLSQYGDLAASAIKRKFGIKDFANYLPGHGGLLDRFDGWIFVLPIVWIATVLG